MNTTNNPELKYEIRVLDMKIGSTFINAKKQKGIVVSKEICPVECEDDEPTRYKYGIKYS